MPYADREKAVAALTELLDATPPAHALDTLDASAGDRDGTTVYRPYLVAALTFAGGKNTTRVHEAEGTIFDAPMTTIRALLEQQGMWDTGLVVPDGWSVAEVRARLFGAGRVGSRLARSKSRF